ncbi:flagellar biosynthetic protein FlhB [Catenovulum agarivorans DS-2]|uniref:Flagellar biosynthetic protein FlhB n=1 Tax=Catenovulum agarivorans DS-2 TaxID=1328313 RepID=W7QLD3_9ALTE|nr:flagellar biosynthesis protein FlhB [Catenovulum agarivorans]EWH09737.1 flagellar biosynthetic protein FlhB [Catenovulum agarivorans DS-2]
MAADDQDRTEEPTAKKKSDARNKGQIPRSRELGTMMVLVGGGIGFLLWGHYVAGALFRMFQEGFILEREDAFDMSRMLVKLEDMMYEIMWPVLTVLIVLVVFAVIGNIAVGGYNFSTKAMQPKLSKMNPINGIKRIFGMQGLIELVKSIAKVAVVIGSAYMCFNLFYQELLHINIENMPSGLFKALEILIWVFLILSCSLIIITLIDVPYQLYNHNEQLKMTKQEVKDEHKNAEGDPQVKGRIRSAMFRAHQRRMLQEVPKADVVVTNPTHFAVALKYDPLGTGAPRLVAKGADEMAAHIRKIAEAHQVPILTAPLLARAIYYTTEFEEEIPEKLFAAVAQVLAYVFALRDYKKGKVKKRPKQFTPSKLPIPPDMQY